jgi:hypothetical protein
VQSVAQHRTSLEKYFFHLQRLLLSRNPASKFYFLLVLNGEACLRSLPPNTNLQTLTQYRLANSWEQVDFDCTKINFFVRKLA